MNYQVYVGTYHKYNTGSLFGEWVDLAEFDDSKEFYEYCAELHSDEEDPEFMFQDWEGIPDQFISESHINNEFWTYMDTVESSHLEDDVFEAGMNLGLPYQDIEELYQGYFSSDVDFAQSLAEDLGLLDNTWSWPHSCIDWEWAARELMYDYGEDDGHYFRTSY